MHLLRCACDAGRVALHARHESVQAPSQDGDARDAVGPILGPFLLLAVSIVAFISTVFLSTATGFHILCTV